MKQRHRLHFNWRLILVHTLANALALGLTVFLLPGVRLLGDRPVVALLISGLFFGILNALLRPILQFLTFRFLFVTFGLVLIAINVLLLWVLGKITPGWFQVDGLLWLVVAAMLVGVFGIVAEVLLGLRPPILNPAAAASLQVSAVPALEEVGLIIEQMGRDDSSPTNEPDSTEVAS